MPITTTGSSVATTVAALGDAAGNGRPGAVCACTGSASPVSALAMMPREKRAWCFGASGQEGFVLRTWVGLLIIRPPPCARGRRLPLSHGLLRLLRPCRLTSAASSRREPCQWRLRMARVGTPYERRDIWEPTPAPRVSHRSGSVSFRDTAAPRVFQFSTVGMDGRVDAFARPMLAAKAYRRFARTACGDGTPFAFSVARGHPSRVESRIDAAAPR